MQTLFRILRALLVTVIVVPLALPLILYVTLSFDGVRSAIAQRAEMELTSLLGTDVAIGEVDFAPFNRIVLRGVEVADSTGRPALTVGHLGAGISVAESLWHGRPVVTYAELMDINVRLTRDSAGAPINIAPIIDRFRKKEPGGPSAFDLSVNMVVVRRSALTYDILDSPPPEHGRFDPAHISVSDIRADLRAPRISDSIFEIDLKRMGAFERSGLSLSLLSASLTVGRRDARVDNLTIELPHSHIAFDDITIPSPLAEGFSLTGPDFHTRIATLPDTYISGADIAPLLPLSLRSDAVVDLELEAEGSARLVTIGRLAASLRDSESYLALHGEIAGLDGGRDSLTIDLPRLNLNTSVPALMSWLERVGHIPANLAGLSALGRVDLMASASASATSVSVDGSVITACGDIDIDATLSRPTPAGPVSIEGDVDVISFDPSELLPQLSPLTGIGLHARADLTMAHGKPTGGVAELLVSEAVWQGRTYTDLSAEARFTPHHVDFQADSRTPGFDFALSGGHDLDTPLPATELFADIRALDLSAFISSGRLSGCTLSTTVDASATGIRPDDITGWLSLKGLTFASAPQGTTVSAGDIMLEVDRSDSTRTVTLASRPVDLNLSGDFTYASLARDLRGIASRVLPSLIAPDPAPPAPHPTATLDIHIKEDTLLNRLFGVPVEVIEGATLRAAADGGMFDMRLDAPYLRQKDKLIEGTGLTLSANASAGTAVLTASTTVPTKNGPMHLSLLTDGGADSTATRIKWKIDREKDFHGMLDISAAFSRPDDGKGLLTSVRFRPTELVFNDSAWAVAPGVVTVRPGLITVDGLGGSRPGQSLTVNGTASADSLSRVVADLDHIDLDYIFETLAISDAVMFGGTATGRLYGDALLSSSPILYTPGLHVDSIAYNNCVMGDADIISWWDNNTKTVTIKADIDKGPGRASKINGYIRPASEELVFNFDAERAPVGFMLPFMAAFTSEIDGEVSGHARLYGTFKDLDLEGKIFADSLRMKLDFTNTVYTVTDSVTLRPGRITFSDVVLSDKFGHTALLSGEVGHRYFHDPTFRFDITGAKDLLVYDIGEHDTDTPWYGRIFGRGGASVRGVPGRIDIGVTMVTEPQSTFTFVLSDSQESVDYDFITFRDRDKARKDSLAALDPTPLIVRQLRERVRHQVDGPPSQYVMDFNVDVTPEATLNLIMDPVGGDRIVAHGAGHINMRYDSQGELEMRGDYTINHGTYNFTLQDIILKDFTIREGSRISFSGDPYAAQLDITAAYSCTPNLTDLDESFQQDPELNRTTVKVNALMMVRGDMRSPDISYDLEFPSLTSDIDRKVKSIISTDEMMSQQIIYLLALNRFYTPDYMAATHGNELVSVASSTLSSRISSMLGALSDTWSIAPAIRSSKGDFSDVEVDVALSSQLLDNRLLLNGNFGYRDKSLNNNSFIGDFDIRYLLNRAGTIQLKAYNRYNDQNYYLKSALTTQGVGIVFKRDFDSVFSFLRPWLRKKAAGQEEKKDSIP